MIEDDDYCLCRIFTDFTYIRFMHWIAVNLLPLFKSNWSLVFTNHIGFVSVLDMNPAVDAEHTCTIAESGGKRLFQNCLA